MQTKDGIEILAFNSLYHEVLLANRDTKPIFAVWGKKRVEVGSISEAVAKWTAFRDGSGAGVSQIGNGVRIVDAANRFVARISYNGRVWNTEENA